MHAELELYKKGLAEDEQPQYGMMRGKVIQQMAVILTICCFCLWIEGARAQSLDSVQVKIGTVATVASQDYQPLWLVSNRWGTITDQKADVSSYLTFYNKHVFGRTNPVYSYLRSSKNYPEFSLSYGLSVFNYQHLQETFIQEGYVKLNLNYVQLKAGRYKEIIGEVDPLLSSGSLGVSGNALPIPKVSIGVADYTDIPFISPGWLQFKGKLSHGWMEKDTFVKSTLLHEKNLYVRIGKRPFNTFHVYGGLNHFVIWSGDHPKQGQLWNDWKDLTRIIVPGNTVGFFDYGFSFLSKHHRIKAYTQVPFEGRSSVSIFRIKDRLVGLTLSSKRKDALLSAVALEMIHTTWQDTNPENPTRENDYNFYNNERYQTGWHYAGSIIGTPLFFDRQRATHYFGEGFSSTSTYDWNIVNNRIKGFHLAGRGYLMPELTYRTKLAWTKNYGNYYNRDLFEYGKTQWYFMQELIYQYDALKLNATIGYDMGDLTSNVGVLLGIEYDLNYKADHKYLGPVKLRRKRSMFRRRF